MLFVSSELPRVAVISGGAVNQGLGRPTYTYSTLALRQPAWNNLSLVSHQRSYGLVLVLESQVSTVKEKEEEKYDHDSRSCGSRSFMQSRRFPKSTPDTKCLPFDDAGWVDVTKAIRRLAHIAPIQNLNWLLHG